MQAAYRKLKDLLWQMFQFDAADLDFGIYRILNLRRTELTGFLDEELLPQVRTILGGAAGDRAALEAELRRIEEQASSLGVEDVTALQGWKAARAKLDAAPDTEALANEVFADLATFFARYYDDGDFLSLPRWNKDVYAIPYDGSEVKLHWANADQYYVKTTETFSRYAAEIEGAAGLGGKLRLELVVVSAESERDNTKAAGKRRFVLADEDAVRVDGTTLRLAFAWRTLDGEEGDGDGGGKRKAAPRQDALNAEIEERVKTHVGPAWKVALGRAAGEEGKRTVLGLHLYRFTRRNTSDYFIHKNLGGFLRRELDHYLKTEVLLLDDLDEAATPEVEAALRRVRAGRAVGRKIIDWLAQIEDFQKKLFLKKKFVLRTEWAVTLDRVPRELWGEILGCEAQQRRWEELFDVAGVSGDLVRASGAALDMAFLEENVGLVVETGLLGGALGAVVRSFVLQQPTTDILIRGENRQALSLLKRQYRATVTGVFVDPPYNTGSDGFMYKDQYASSSWLSMAADRFEIAWDLLADTGSLTVCCDDQQAAELRQVLDAICSRLSYYSTVVWQKKDTPSNDASGFSVTHDYLHVYARPNLRRGLVPRTDEQLELYKNPDGDPRGPWTRGALTRKEFVARDYYALTGPAGQRVFPPPGTSWRLSKTSLEKALSDNRIWWGADGTGTPYLKRFLTEVSDGVVPTTWWDYRFAGSNRNAKLELRALFPGDAPFETPKPTRLAERVVQLTTADFVLDFFAGSGTTGHAVINLNREDGGNRRFILVEMGDHFDTVLVPRILKATYSKEWKDGKPVDRQGVSATYKIQYLESYDDTLENIELRRDPTAASLLERSDTLREDYTLRYLLDLESRGSLLDLGRFRKPWDYRIKVRKDGVVQEQPVDLVETFNYLVGLHVDHVSSYGNDGILFVEGRVDGRRALVIWRDCDSVDDSLLNVLFRKAYGDVRGSEYERIWVNGDNQLENARLDGERWKVRLTEEDFHALMFDTSDAE